MYGLQVRIEGVKRGCFRWQVVKVDGDKVDVLRQGTARSYLPAATNADVPFQSERQRLRALLSDRPPPPPAGAGGVRDAEPEPEPLPEPEPTSQPVDSSKEWFRPLILWQHELLLDRRGMEHVALVAMRLSDPSCDPPRELRPVLQSFQGLTVYSRALVIAYALEGRVPQE